MFHLKYPKFRGFFTWEELGCLARALGYPVDLFKKNVTGSELVIEEHGLSLKESYKMVDHRLLEGALHRTCNLHSGDWNMNVVRKCLYFLSHSAITFEELYNIRIAYQAYEQFDMKGMLVDEETILASIKMCGRSIAPMKLMHRLKHMSAHFEDKTRIQLTEYLDLILWCGEYKDYTPGDVPVPQGKEKDLYRLVDFEQLLSHYDARLAKKLNNEYLKEEWDFGQENLGNKKMFTEPPIISAQERIDMARKQQRLYKHLKKEIMTSQKMVYRVKAGFVRDRPLTAPDLSMYRRNQKGDDKPELTTRRAYEKIQHRINSANRAKATSPSLCDTSDRPQYIPPPERQVTPVVTEEEIHEAQEKVDNLIFDIETVEKRHKLNMEQMLNFYMPGFTDRMAEKEEDNTPQVLVSEPTGSERRTTSEETVHHLAYPESPPSHSHSNTCDARYRGWHDVQNKKGDHYVLTSPTYENSYQGRLRKKLYLRSKAQVKNFSSEFAYRYTKSKHSSKLKKESSRPNTAPAVMQSFEDEEEIEEAPVIMKGISPTDSSRTVDTGYGSSEGKSFQSSKSSIGQSHVLGSEQDSIESKSPTDFQALSYADSEEPLSTTRSSENCDIVQIKHSNDKSPSLTTEMVAEPQVFSTNNTDMNKNHKKSSLIVPKDKISVDEIPVPQMQHTKPKVVAVGGIGKISLLESISELQQWEEEEDPKEENSHKPLNSCETERDEDCRSPMSENSAHEERSMQLNLNLLSRRLSGDYSVGKKHPSKARIDTQALTVAEKLEMEKQARLKKQKKLHGAKLEKMGIITPQKNRSKSSSSGNSGRTSTSSCGQSPTPRNMMKTREVPAKSELSKASVAKKNESPRQPVQKGTPNHSHVHQAHTTHKNSRYISTHQVQKNFVRNNVTATTSYDKENTQMNDANKNVKKPKDNGNNANISIKGNKSVRESSHGKYDRLMKRVEGYISENFAKRLQSPAQKV